MKGLLICLLSCNSILFAQTPNWKNGVVVLDSDVVRVGQICVLTSDDLILFRVHDSVSVYAAHRIQSALFYDEKINVNRKFISIKDENTSFRISHLYEIVLQGDWSVLRRPRQGTDNVNTLSDRDDFKYYLRSDEQLVSLAVFRQVVYPQLLENSHDELLSFIGVNKLNPNEPASAIRIIDFYNKRKTIQLASLEN